MKQKLMKLRGHTDQLLNIYLGLRRKYSIAERMATDAELHAGIDDLKIAAPFKVLRHAAMGDCINDIVKLTLDRSTGNVPSVTNLMNALEGGAIRELRELFAVRSSIPRQSSDDESIEQALTFFEDKFQAERRRDFDALLAELQDRWQTFQKSQVVSRLRTLRDRHLAHLELRQKVDGSYEYAAKGEPVKPEQLSWAMGELRWFVVRLTLLIRSTSTSVDYVERQFDDQAYVFWRRLLTGRSG